MRIYWALLVLLIGECVCAAAPAKQPSGKNLTSIPAEAQASISGALGQNVAAYHAQERAYGFHTEDLRHQLKADFRTGGVTIDAGSNDWQLRLEGWGYGDSLTAESAVAPVGKANRIEYRRGSISEWYVHGPMGLEQGFTIASPPQNPSGRPLTIAMQISGSLKPRVNGEKDLSLVDDDGRAQLRYSGLVARDAAGEELPSWLEVKNDRVLLRVSDQGAKYPLTIDPWVQSAELISSDGAAADEFSWSVATSGNTVVVGAPFHAVGANQAQGAAYVFVEPTGGWANATQTAELTASNGTQNAYFGSSVAISGNTIVVGAPGATVEGNTGEGSGYVFVEPTGGWKNMTQTAELGASDGAAGDNFGQAIAIDSNTVVVGAPYATIGSNYQQGAAYIFTKPGNGWTNLTQTAKFAVSTGAAGDIFGASVTVSGKLVVGGSPQATISGNTSAGAAYVFVEPSGGWTNATQTAELTASDAMQDDYLGAAVSASGNTVAVGAPSDYSGAVYIYVQPSGGWTDMTQTAELTVAGATSQVLLGTSVAIDANTVLSGGVGTAVNGNQFQGAIYVFIEPTGGWQDMNQTYQMTASDGAAGDYFGRSIAVRESTGVAGAPHHAVGSNPWQGTSYIFQPLNPRPSLTGISPNNTVAGSPAFTLTVTGTNFVNGTVVNWKNSARVTTYVSTTEVKAAILASDVAQPGTAWVNATNPAPGGGKSYNGATFTIENPVPGIISLSPSTVLAGQTSSTPITVNGSGFISTSKVLMNGNHVQTTYVSGTKLTATLPANLTAGTAQITVVNPAPGGGTSNPATLNINNPVPTLSKLTPATAKAGGPAFTLTVTGMNFVPTSQAFWNGKARTTTYVGHLTVKAAILASDIAKAGTAQVTVGNPTPGGGTSNALTFTIKQ